MAAESDRLVLAVAAVWISTVLASEFEQRKMPRLDRGATEVRHLQLSRERLRPVKRAIPGLGASLAWSLDIRRTRQGRLRSPQTSEPHPLGPAERGVAGVARVELRID